MPDLTLYEFSELKEEEIKTRLLNDYNTISYGSGIPDDAARISAAGKKNMKLVHNIKIHIIRQFKSILVKGSL